MYLYASDWSAFRGHFSHKQLPAGSHMIKVFSSPKDPREILGKDQIKVWEESGLPFDSSENFSYKGRGVYRGVELDHQLREKGLDELGLSNSRALFRFANRQEVKLCQRALTAKVDGRWFKDHPLQYLDGLEKAARYGSSYSMLIHIDVLHRLSVEELGQFIDLEKPQQLVD